jgi:predicted mannosyl-3-phosphoglycerate phosphatase (HAD superfamily)
MAIHKVEVGVNKLMQKVVTLQSELDSVENEINGMLPYNGNDKECLSDIAGMAREALWRHRNGFEVDLIEVLNEIEDAAYHQSKLEY